MDENSTIFIIYSHNHERRWVNYVVDHLNFAENQGALRNWHDRNIKGGVDWQTEVENALATAKIAILLVSHNSLTSKYVISCEVEIMIQRRKADCLLDCPIMIRPCDWQAVD